MSVCEFIRSEVNRHEVSLFMKGTPTAPACGFSAQVVRILDHLNIPFQSYNVYDSEELRQGIKDYSDWPTIPQLYVRGEFMGGCDIITEMFRSGELQQLFPKRQPTVAAES